MGSSAKKPEKGPEIIVIEIPFSSAADVQTHLNEVCEKGYTLLQFIVRFSDAPVAIFQRKPTKEEPVN